MTAGLPIITELRDGLARLLAGEPFAWQRIAGSYDLLRRALVQAVRGSEGVDPSALLDECWVLLSRPEAGEQVARFHRLDPHYAGVNVDAVWLHRNACALMASARAAVAAQRHDATVLLSWAGVAGELLGHRGDAPEAVRESPTATPEERIDLAFAALTEGGWRVQGARVWTLAWLPSSVLGKGTSARRGRHRRRRHGVVLNGPAVRVPVAGCFDGKGFLADLCLHRLPGDGELVPLPETALQPLGAQLLGGLRAAWDDSRQSVCFTFGVHDAFVPSWVPLEGASLSGAAALGFELLRHGQGGDAGRLVIAQSAPDGALAPVGHEVEKMQAALAGGVRSVVLAVESQVPETCVERFRQSGQEVVRARSMREVLDLPPVGAQKPARQRRRVVTAVVVSVALAVVGLGAAASRDDGGRCPRASSPDLDLVAAAVWSDNEQTAFQSVLQAFCDRTGIRVRYNLSDTVDMAEYLEERACDPPDVAMLAQPGLMRELARDGRLYPLGGEAVANLEANYTPESRRVGVIDHTPYGVYFKASNKSMWWYNVQALKKANIAPPTTWEEMLESARVFADAGVPWVAIGGENGWPLTDLFENIYLRTAGADKYDELAAHRIGWDDESVVGALRRLGELIGNEQYLAGGSAGVLRTDWRAAVRQVVRPMPAAVTTFEGDFVAGVAREQTKAQPGVDFDFFDFPSIGRPAPAVIGGGDIGVALTPNAAAQRLLAFLATPEAASVWARRPGFISPNRSVDEAVYRDELTRRAARTLVSTQPFRFDLSDQQPASFGAKPGAGMWLRLQDFVRDGNPQATAQALEADAKKAYEDASRASPPVCRPA